MFQALFALVFLFKAASKAVLKPTSIIFYAAFSLSYWGAGFAQLGVNIDLSRLSLLLIAIYVVFHINVVSISERYWSVISVILFLWLFPLAIGFYHYADIIDYGYAFGQKPNVRPFIQLFQRLTFICLFLLPFIFKSAQRDEIILLGLKGYILGTSLQCILGLYQVVAYKTGLPVWQYSLGELQYVSGFARLSALAGEPRHFAVFTLPSLCFLLFNLLYMKLNVIKRKYQISLFFLHLISLVLSFSATGIFIAGISIFFGFLIYMRTKHILSMLLMLGLVISVVATFISYSDEDALNARVIDRVNMEFYQKSEYSTYAVYELLSEKPGFIWTGLGVGLPTYFLKEMPSYKSAYSRNTKLTLNTVRDPSGIALILMESGIIALLLLSYLVVFFVRTCRSSKDKLQSITAYFLLCVFFTGLVSYGPLSPLFAFFLGLFFAQQSSRRAYAIAR